MNEWTCTSTNKSNLPPPITDLIAQVPKVTEAAKAKFKDKNVLLTGSSGGLGRSIAHHLAACGTRRLILSGRNVEALEKVAQECRVIIARSEEQKQKQKITSTTPSQHGLVVDVFPCDLSDSNAVQRLGANALGACSRHVGSSHNTPLYGDGDSGTIDVLINNGGLSSRSRFVDTKIEVDELLMKVNFLAGASLAKIVVPEMIVQQQKRRMMKKANGEEQIRNIGSIIWISSIQGLGKFMELF